MEYHILLEKEAGTGCWRWYWVCPWDWSMPRVFTRPSTLQPENPVESFCCWLRHMYFQSPPFVTFSPMICSDWSENEHLAFNTWVVSATLAAFFETPKLPPLTVSITILNNIDKPGQAFARPLVKDDHLFIQYMRLVEKSHFSETSKLALKELAIFIQLTGHMRGSKSVTDYSPRWRLPSSHEHTFLSPQFVYSHCAHIIPVSVYSKVTHKPFEDAFSSFLHLSRHKHMPQFGIFTGSALDVQIIQDSRKMVMKST